MTSFFLLLLIVPLALADKVVQFSLETEDQVRQLDRLQQETELDVWRQPGVKRLGEVSISPQTAPLLLPLLKSWGISYEIIIDNLESLAQKQMEQNDLAASRIRVLDSLKFRSRSRASTVVGYFARHSAINAWLDTLASENSFASVQSIGNSYQGRAMKVLKLSTGSNRRAIVMDSAIHAREWLAPATLNYIIDKLITGYKSGDTTARSLLSRFDLYFLPVANPDGYEYSFTSSRTRLWRKTRQPHSSGCPGADPNRNFDSHFRLAGTSTNPCSITYGGPYPWSEPETVNMREFFRSLANSMVLYMPLHSYAQMWLTPWGYTSSPPRDNAELMRVANIGNNALYKVNRVRFRVGSPPSLLYAASGGAFDWVKEKLNVKYAYTLELQPVYGTRNGFIVPTYYIRPSGEEIYAALIGTANAMQL